PETPAGSPDAPFVALRDRYFVRTLAYNPVTSTYLGGDGYDESLRGINGKLRDWSSGGQGQEQQFYAGILQELDTLDPAALSQGAQVDYRVLKAQLGFLRHDYERKYYQRAVDTYIAEPFRGIDWQIQQMQSFDGGALGNMDEWNEVIQRLEAIPGYVDVAKANLLAGRTDGNLPDRRMVQRDGINGGRANAEYFRTTLPAQAQEYLASRPFAGGIMTRLTPAAAAAGDAYASLAAWMEQNYDLNETTDRFAAGEPEYAWRVRNCLQVNRTPAQLWDYGAQQVALYEAKIFDVAQEVARQAQLPLSFSTDAERRDSVRKVMEFLSRDSPRNDDELFRWYREVGERAVAYGREQKMFDIPADYRLDVVATPPVLRSTIDAAYYPAPPFRHAGVGRFYLTPTGNDPAALRLNNRASVADTAVHEGFPGHDWHFKFMTEHAAEISNIRWLPPGAVEDSSSMWEDSMATEGWGLYSEELMAEPVEGRPHGFYSAAEHLYELQGQLLRAVRVRVDVGLHTGRMSFNEAMDYFTEHVSFYPGACAAASADPNARAICEGALRAIYRYSKWPTQAITYNLGKNEILELRQAYQAAMGANYSAKAFHEKLMKQGTIPAGYYRNGFVG
ncbi:MAG: DUF885 domain-containing protein, partial [Gemmatimonadales bacterium]